MQLTVKAPRAPAHGVLAQVLSEDHQSYLGLGTFTRLVESASTSEGDALRLRVLRILENGLAAGYLAAGDTLGGQFHPWPDSYTQTLKRIESAWPAGGLLSHADLQEVCCLAKTASGERIAAFYRTLWSGSGAVDSTAT
ncbi:hypothetical protein J2Y41_003893 [Arthrobacter sp. 1088]|uniref:hypothetical protein n=1 Tax=Arthrobacter sp. 1088 TaxID=2817768 RepID=UPI002862D7B8|nr:hypothetical protein [Arthrobacter sp. 1088]MDR6688307.1 hypothetical protein [Arthrobacter sp. 1088]